MRQFFLIVAIAAAGSVALAPPGLCPCWLMPDPGRQHPHLDGRPDRPHRHDFLSDLVQMQTAAAGPLLSAPIHLWIAAQAASGLWRRIVETLSPARGWAAAPLTPPPRGG